MVNDLRSSSTSEAAAINLRRSSTNEATWCGRRVCFEPAASIASKGWRKQIARTPKDRCLCYEDAWPHLWPPLSGPYMGELYGFAQKAQFLRIDRCRFTLEIVSACS